MTKAIFIILLYLLTAPTNMVCLGAFTESWLKTFNMPRQTLTYIYFVSTFLVFFVLKWVPWNYSLRTSLYVLGGAYLLTYIGPYILPFPFIISVVFFLLQYIGQGCCVQICRIGLFQQTPLPYYSKTVGWMEGMGTCTVFLLPFLLLLLIKSLSWQRIVLGLSLLYILVACFVPANLNLSIICPQKENNKSPNLNFWSMNLIIYLPVLTTSGLFFHIEGLSQKYNIDLPILSLCTMIQIMGSIGFQIVLGYLIGEKWRRLKWVYSLQIFSQILWLWSIFHFQTLGRIYYTITGMIGWGCFGLLVNVLWYYLYGSNVNKTILSLQESVRFGFLANALGPCLFYLFL